MPPFKPPKSGDLGKRGKHILGRVYIACRNKNPSDSQEDKAMCARIAWGAVHKAGYR